MTGAGAVAAIVLLCWAVGSVAGAAWVQSWRVVTRGHFRIVGWCAVSVGVLGGLASLSTVEGGSGLDTRLTLVGLFELSALVYLAAQYRAEDGMAALIGAGSGVVGAFALVATAGLIEDWAPLLSMSGLLAGAAVLGAVTNGMLLGHWYLNQPGLKPWALARLTIAGIAVTALAGVLGLVSASRLMGAPTEGAALGLPGFGNDFGPAFFFIWLALTIFTGAILYMVKRCIDIRSIQSATGLYYVAILTAGVAEFLVRYLMVGAR
jgi:hypothetical protein